MCWLFWVICISSLQSFEDIHKINCWNFNWNCLWMELILAITGGFFFFFFWWVLHHSRSRRHGFDSWVGKILWSRKWQPIIFVPGEFHGQRSVVGYSPWDHKELGKTEWLSVNKTSMTHTHRCIGYHNSLDLDDHMDITQFFKIYQAGCSRFVHAF